MCGISGIIRFDNKEVDRNYLKKMSSTLHHRGPDSSGHWLKKNIGLGHNRLKIIDLSDKANQPFIYKNLIIVFNGEIYNYLEIKEKLLKLNYQFKSQSDTEVLLIAYYHYGEKVLDMLDGMFAFCILNTVTNDLFIARDRFGEKPLYFLHNSKKLIFASEIKAIKSVEPLIISNRMIINYIKYDTTEDIWNKEKTFYKNINQLEASHFLKVKSSGEIIKKRYWKLNSHINDQLSPKEYAQKIDILLSKSIKRRVRSDVEIGALLSGGLDSSIITKKLIELNPNKLNVFSARFKDLNYDEGIFIDKFKNEKQIIFNKIWPNESLIASELKKIFHHHEEPFGSPSIVAQWGVYKSIGNKGIKVVFDGQGADEVFSGYPKYFSPYLFDLYKNDYKSYKEQKVFIEKHQLSILNIIESFSPVIFKIIADKTRFLRNKNQSNDINKNFLQFEKNQPPANRISNLNEYLKFDLQNYGIGKLLKNSDRNSMAFSVETRVPYIFHELVEYVFQIPTLYKMMNGWTKYLLRKSAENYLYKDTVFRKDKMSFQMPVDYSKLEINEILNNSIHSLKQCQIISTPKKENYWKYIMLAQMLEFADN